MVLEVAGVGVALAAMTAAAGSSGPTSHTRVTTTGVDELAWAARSCRGLVRAGGGGGRRGYLGIYGRPTPILLNTQGSVNWTGTWLPAPGFSQRSASLPLFSNCPRHTSVRQEPTEGFCCCICLLPRDVLGLLPHLTHCHLPGTTHLDLSPLWSGPTPCPR